MASNALTAARAVNTLAVTGISDKVFTLSNINETYHSFNISEQRIIMQMQYDIIDGTRNNSGLGSLNSIAIINNSNPNDSSVSDSDSNTISLIYFTGFYQNESYGIELRWTTVSESNNNYFTLERSTDGLTFSAIISILGNGTTSAVNKYQYTDKNSDVKRDSCYYRLSQTDLDGTKKNLETIYVRRELKLSKIWVYPTPVQQTQNIHIDFDGLQEGIYTMAILNSNGDRIVQDQVNINYNFQSMEIETNNIPNGLYIVHIFSTADTFIQRIIVQ
jgi:hypothetical protein